jgi:small subunit ribosomal protein S8
VAVNDPIADLLTRIRNAIERGIDLVEMPSSRMREAIAHTLAEEGYIEGYEVEEGRVPSRAGFQPVLRIRLRYLQVGPRARQPAIRGLRRISRPSRRVYVGASEIPEVRAGLGICILSTPQGVMTGREARRCRQGGELLCEVW